MNHWPDGNSDHARVYWWLKTRLIEYRFRPGEQLLIGPIADRLRVSSTPVREALIRLQSEALLDPAPRRGFFAKTLSLQEMTELHELGFIILKLAIEKSVTSDPATVEALQLAPAAIRLRDPLDPKASPLDRDVRRHARHIERACMKLTRACGNDVIEGVMRNVIERTHLVRMLDLEAPDRIREAMYTIDEVVFALRRKDTAYGIGVLARELDAILQRMPDLVKEGITRSCAAMAKGSSITLRVQY